MPSEYRPEIDGLRALAVIPVVFFHAGVPGFSGGYIGVDIFFVISGYLITGILLRSIQHNNFSVLDFYERRIRRIFPALISVLIATLACASWLLFPEELTNYGKSLFATSLFYANYHFMLDTGYFAAPAESKPLLHMWSLAVEEQFYVLFPLYLYVMLRWYRRWCFPFTMVLGVLSLGYSIWLMGQTPDQTFYSTPARAWELFTGALLALNSLKLVLVSRWALYAMGRRFRSELGHVVFIIDSHSTSPSLATNQEVFERGLMNTLDKLAKLGRKVIVVSQVPEAEYRIPLAMARAEHLRRKVQLAPGYREYLSRQGFVEGVFARYLPRNNGTVFRPEEIICVAEKCKIAIDGLPIYRDSNHLSRRAAMTIAPVFKPLFSSPSTHREMLADAQSK